MELARKVWRLAGVTIRLASVALIALPLALATPAHAAAKKRPPAHKAVPKGVKKPKHPHGAGKMANKPHGKALSGKKPVKAKAARKLPPPKPPMAKARTSALPAVRPLTSAKVIDAAPPQRTAKMACLQDGKVYLLADCTTGNRSIAGIDASVDNEKL